MKTRTFAAFYKRVQPLQVWCNQARALVKDYYKAIDLKHNQLNLMDSQLVAKPFDGKNPFEKPSSDQGAENEQSDDVQIDSRLGDHHKIMALVLLAKRAGLESV